MEHTVIDTGGPGNPFVMKLDQAFSLSRIEPMRRLTLDNGEQEVIIDFGGDSVTYSGELPVDEAAKLLFDAVFQRLKPRCQTCRCQTCRWFNNGGWYVCDCPKMIYGYKTKVVADDEVAVENDENWGMIPGPNFGCIHHKEKS